VPASGELAGDAFEPVAATAAPDGTGLDSGSIDAPSDDEVQG
jgi:hypothetical protein